MSDTPGGRRFSVNVNARRDAALARLIKRTGRQQQDAVGHAIEIYDYVEERKAEGCELLIRRPDGTLEAVVII